MRIIGLAALAFYVACASGPAVAPMTAVSARTAYDDAGDSFADKCTTVLDCMRARGSPPAGVAWTCSAGLCGAQFASPSEPAK